MPLSGTSIAGSGGVCSVLCVGSATMDFVFGVDRMPAGATKHRAFRFEAIGGGNAANAAVAAARLGAKVFLAGRVGDDLTGEAIRRDLEKDEVDTRLLLECKGMKSSVSSIFVDGRGERLIMNYTDLSVDESAEPRPALPSDVAVVVGDAKWPVMTAQLFREVRERGGLALLDADMPQLPEALLKLSTHVAFSRDGLRHASGEATIEDGLRRFAERCDAVLIATDGANGVYWLDNAALLHLPAFRVDPIDTLGAGDVFHGALAVALGEKRDLSEALRFASAAAAIKVTQFGGRAGCPSRESVMTFLESWGS